MNYCMSVTNFSSFPWNKSTLNAMAYLEKNLIASLQMQIAESFLGKNVNTSSKPSSLFS